MEEIKANSATELETVRQKRIGKWSLCGMIAFTVVMASYCAFTQPIAVTLAVLAPGVTMVIVYTSAKKPQ